VACDRREQADEADSDAPLTARCPVPMPRWVNFWCSRSGTERGRPVSSGGDLHSAFGLTTTTSPGCCISSASRCNGPATGFRPSTPAVGLRWWLALAAHAVGLSGAWRVAVSARGGCFIDSLQAAPLLPLRIPETSKRRRGSRAMGCERGVRINLVIFHAPVTGRPAFSRRLWCFPMPPRPIMPVTRYWPTVTPPSR
jgi:hypothetical protein